MSKPDIDPKKTAAGIAIDPKTLERVIPESKRPDGTIRKQVKIRPGFTPQEDVGKFRGSRQQQFEKIQLPKGHILGWIAPSSEKKGAAAKTATTPTASGSTARAAVAVAVAVAGSGGAGDDKPLTKSAAKNAKRKAKKQAEKDKVVKDNWEDSDGEEKVVKSAKEKPKDATTDGKTVGEASVPDNTVGDALAEELEKKLDVH